LRFHILAAAGIAALAAPAFAQSSSTFPEEADREIIRSLPSPDQVEDMADVAGSAAEAILDVPIGGVVRAIDPSRRVRRDDTIADVVGQDDPYLRERVRDSVGGLAVGMQDMISQVAIVAPELRRALAGIEESLDRSLRTRRDRDYDRDYSRDYDRDYDSRRR
jgi:hypothetical protein